MPYRRRDGTDKRGTPGRCAGKEQEGGAGENISDGRVRASVRRVIWGGDGDMEEGLVRKFDLYCITSANSGTGE